MKSYKLLSTIALAALVGCSSVPVVQPSSPARWNSITVEVHWLKKQQVGEVCNRLGLPDTMFKGCARSKPDNISICEVYAVQPESFEDYPNLETLGHEVWHCFGAQHK